MAFNVLDVSQYNPIQDYSAAAGQIDGVIMRLGYRGYGTSGTLVKDTLFETHYQGFVNKTKIGVYFFTQATNAQEGIAEADFVYNYIRDKQIDFPVYIDNEYSNSNHNGRADNITIAKRTEAIIAFCDRIRELGYEAGIYASDSWWYSMLDMNQILPKNYSLWVASYSYAPKRVKSYDGWQYSSNETIAGYTSRVDKSYFYNDVAGWGDEKKDLADAEVTLDLNEVTYYNGQNRPVPTVKFAGSILTLNTHYTISYGENIYAGRGTVTVTGKGLYSGSKTVEFTINPRNINLSVLVTCGEPNEDGCYDISNLIVSFDYLMIEGTDYTKTVSESMEGNYKYTVITLTGIGNFTGTRTLSYPTEKLTIPIDDFGVEFTKSFVYTGSDIEPGIILKDGETHLSPNTDYNLSYSDNINIGTATITVSGKGDYSGTKTLHFTITPRNINTGVMGCGSINKRGYYNFDNFNIICNDLTLVKDTDYTLNIEEDIKTAGYTTTTTYNITATGQGNFEGTLTGSFIVNIDDSRTDIETISMSIPQTNYSYTGEEIRPEVTVTGLTKDTDYTIEYKDNLNAGNATITVTGKGNYIGFKEIIFTIIPLNIEGFIVSCGSPDGLDCYNLNNLSISHNEKILVKETDYTYSIIEVEPDDKFYKSTILITGRGNYIGNISKSYHTGIIPPDPKSIGNLNITVEPLNFEYSGEENIPNVSISDDEEGYTLELNRDYKIEVVDNINVGAATLTITGLTETYYGVKTYTLIINPIDISDGILSCGSADEQGCYNLENIALSVRSKILTKDTDYSVHIESYESESHYMSTVTATGQGNYSGSVTKDFRTGKINRPLSREYFVMRPEILDYTGEQQYPEIKSSLTKDVDYELVYEPISSIEPATYHIHAIGIGKYFGDIDFLYRINPHDLNSEDITVTFNPPDAQGCYDVSSMKVKRGSEELVYYKDYKYYVTSEEARDGYVYSVIEVVGIKNYTGTVLKKVYTQKKEYYKGKPLYLDEVNVYVRYSSKDSIGKKSGQYYVWNEKIANGRIRVTNNKDGAGIIGYITGWVDLQEVLNKDAIKVGDIVIVDGVINTYADGSGNNISRREVAMCVTDILEGYSYPYGVASAPNRTRLGWAKAENIKKQS